MAYQQLAHVYDAFMADAPYDQFLDFTLDVFTKFGHDIHRVADLGCGTGKMAVKLAEKGLSVTAIDYSADMLTVAQQHATEKKQDIQFILQDLRELEGLEGLDAAVSYFDVMNYIVSPEDVQETFNHVGGSLRDGGLFLFDVHSIHQIEHHYAGETFSVVEEDMAYIWFCEAGEEPGEVHHDLTFFVQNGSVYERFEECHHQRTYSIDFYTGSLLKAGFKKIFWFGGQDLNLQNQNKDAAKISILAIK